MDTTKITTEVRIAAKIPFIPMHKNGIYMQIMQMLSLIHILSAIYWYEAACQCNPEQAEASGAFVSPECYDFIPFMELCVCWDRLGDHRKAYSYHRCV